MWPYGNFGARLPSRFTPVNAGLIGQTAYADFTEDLENAYAWWTQNVSADEAKYHDEQGAVAFCLQDRIYDNEVLLLSSTTHRVVCPLNSPPLDSVDGLILMHATYPDHPAFRRFLTEISNVTGISEQFPENQMNVGLRS